MFLPFFTPVFAPVRPQNKVNLGDISRGVPSRLPNYSCDLCPKYNIYNVIYQETGRFLLFFTPGFVPKRPQIKVNLGDVSRGVILAASQPLMKPMPQI